MNGITKFQFNDHKVRTVTGPDGEPWFVAKDVCGVLGLANSSQALTRLPSDSKGVISNDTLGGTQEFRTVNESGLYDLIFDSRKPEAKAFRHWVTSEVLPSIRKTGKYETTNIAPVEQRQIDKIEYEMDIGACEAMARMLILSDAGKVQMLSTVCQNHGRPTNILPAYVEDQVDGLGAAAFSKLIKEKWEEDGEVGKKLSARVANAILIELGLLENRTKKCKDGTKECWKVITKKGLEFGKNMTCTKSDWKTNPHWYRSTFGELCAKIEEVINGE